MQALELETYRSNGHEPVVCPKGPEKGDAHKTAEGRDSHSKNQCRDVDGGQRPGTGLAIHPHLAGLFRFFFNTKEGTATNEKRKKERNESSLAKGVNCLGQLRWCDSFRIDNSALKLPMVLAARLRYLALS